MKAKKIVLITAIAVSSTFISTSTVQAQGLLLDTFKAVNEKVKEAFTGGQATRKDPGFSPSRSDAMTQAMDADKQEPNRPEHHDKPTSDKPDKPDKPEKSEPRSGPDRTGRLN